MGILKNLIYVSQHEKATSLHDYDYFARWILRNPDKMKRERIPWKIRRAVLIRAEGRCQWCGNLVGLEQHHIVQRTVGDQSFDNLILLCKHCHRPFRHGFKVGPKEFAHGFKRGLTGIEKRV